jgi:inner membrane protein
VAVIEGLGIALVVIGLVLFTLELIHPGALLLIPGSILLVAGILYLAFPNVLLDSPWGPGIILLSVVVAICIEVPYYRWIAPQSPPMSTTPLALVGQEGVVIAPVVPHTLRGKVRVKSEVWSARSNVPIAVGTRVKIVHGEGVSIMVQPLETAPAA